MASSRPDLDPRGGYATVAAMGVSLAIGLLAGALVLRGVASLKLARSDLRRAGRVRPVGLQVLAATRLLAGSGGGRLGWSAGGLDGEDVTLLAEPESGKLKLTAVADLDDKILAELGASDPGMARLRLAALDPTSAEPDQVEGADPAGGLAGLRGQRDLAVGRGRDRPPGGRASAQRRTRRRTRRPGLAGAGRPGGRMDGRADRKADERRARARRDDLAALRARCEGDMRQDHRKLAPAPSAATPATP